MIKKTLLSIMIGMSFEQAYAAEQDLSKLIANNVDNNKENIQTNAKLNNRLVGYNSYSLFGYQNKNLDLTQFRNSNGIAEGVYSVNVYVNNKSIGENKVVLKHVDSSSEPNVCFDSNLIAKLDLKQFVLDSLPKNDCILIKKINNEAYYDLDISQLRLEISLPLVVVNQRPDGYIDPQLFDQGVNSTFVNYDYNFYHHENKDGQKNDSSYLSLNGGLNLNGFYFRHAGNFESNNSSLSRYTSYLNALHRDISSINSRVTMGDFNTTNYYSDGIYIRGIQLANDSAMRPMTQRSYAPTIRGMAFTNALVSIFQNGRRIYERTVPAGDFEITDLTALSNFGDLKVDITELGGEKRSFVVPLQGNLNLLRKSQLNYSTALGRYKFNRKVTDDTVAQFNFEYGLSDYLTVQANSNLSAVYKSLKLGMNTNTLFGGIRFDVENASSQYKSLDKSGLQLHLQHQYYFTPQKLTFNFRSLYQSRDYFSINNIFSLKNYDILSNSEIENFLRTQNIKTQYSISLNQSFANEKLGSIFASLTDSKYWDGISDARYYTFGYSNRWHNLNYALTYSQNSKSMLNNIADKRIGLSLTLPLDLGSNRVFLNSNVMNSNSSGHPTQTSLGITGLAGENNQFSYGLSTARDLNSQYDSAQYIANANYNLPFSRIGAVANWSKNNNRQYGVNAQGALVLHPHGLTLSHTLSDTFTIIHSENAKGADIKNTWGNKIDLFGNAIYSNLAPYQLNQIEIDPKNVPFEVNFLSNQSEVIPRRYSSTLVKIESKKSTNILLNIRVEDQVQLPIGIQIRTENDIPFGTVGQSNQVLIENEALLKQRMKLTWGKSNENTCYISPIVKLGAISKSNQLNVIDVECKK